MEHRKDNLCSGTPLFFMEIHWNTAAVIFHRNRTVTVNHHINLAAMTGEGLIDGIIHHLKYHVVKTGSVIGITNVHAGALSNSVQPL